MTIKIIFSPMLVTKKRAKILKVAVGLFIATTAIFLLANFALAGAAVTGFGNTPGGTQADVGKSLGLGERDPRVIIASVINFALGFLGIIAVGLIIYAGWLWMTSVGNEEKIERAKAILKNAIIGLIIILSAFAIANFILNQLIGATGGNGVNGPGSGGGSSGLGSAGGEIVDYTFPANNQKNVPRNLHQVSAVLNEPVNPGTFNKDTAEIQAYTVDPTDISKEDEVYKSRLAASPAASFFGRLIEKLPLVKNLVKDFTVDRAAASPPDSSPVLGPALALAGSDFQVAPNGKTLIFNLADRSARKEYLGSPQQTVWYFVTLKKTIKKPDGTSLFSDLSDQGGDIGYHWKFAVGTVIDNTPPKIVSVVPAPAAPDTTDHRNVVVQINFSEAIDPTSASGKLEIDPAKCDNSACLTGSGLKPGGFNNIIVKDITAGPPVGEAGEAVNNFIAGNLYISNQYRTVEFLTFDDCGLNSCGQTIFCLPADKRIKVSLKAASLAEPTAATALYTDAGYDGVVDMAGNSLDGNGNGAAQGPEAQSKLAPYNANSPDQANQGDDYFWTFRTDNITDNTSPKIISIAPAINPGLGEVNASPQDDRTDRIPPPKIIGLTPALNPGLAEVNVTPQAVFDKLLYSASLTKASVEFKNSDFKAGDPEYYYWIYNENNVPAKQTTVYIGHNQFDYTTKYSVQLNSGVRDNYQNCYFPCSSLGITGNPVVGIPSCCEGVPSDKNSCP